MGGGVGGGSVFCKGFELLMGSFCKRARDLDQKGKKELTKKLLKVKN